MGLYQTGFSPARADGLGPDFAVTTTATSGVGLIADNGSALSDTTSTAVALLVSSPASSADQGAQLTCSSTVGVHSVLLRATGTAANLTGYNISFFGSSLQIRRYAGGVVTNLATVGRTKATGDVLRGTVEGSTLRAYVNGGLVLTATHTGITGVGSLGLLTSTAKSTRSRSFYAGDLADFASVPTGGAPIATKPGQVTGLMAGTPTQGSVPLSWAPLVGADDYLLEYRSTTATAWTALNPVTDPTAQITGLATGTYVARVTGRNTTGAGTASATVSITIVITVLRTIRFPMLDPDDRLPLGYMPFGVATTEDVAAAVTPDLVAQALPPRLGESALGSTYAPRRALLPVSMSSVPSPTSPTITKYAGNPIMTKAATGLRSIYWPCLVKVPASVYATNPTLGRWRIYLSTDHDSSSGQIGMLYTGAVNPDDPGATWTAWRHPTSGGAVLFSEGGSTQTETPTVVWNPYTSLFHMYYQVQSGSGTSLLQFTKVATSPDGITWTAKTATALPNPASTQAGFGHTGYAKIWLVDGLWIAWSNLGEGTEVSGASLWYSYDGFTWVRDGAPMRGLLNWSEGTLRTGIGGLLQWRGQLWATGTSGQFTSGTATSEGQAWMAPVNPSLRSLRGRPQYVPFDAVGIETSKPGIPFQWAAGDDGRLWGAYRINSATGAIGLAVMSA